MGMREGFQAANDSDFHYSKRLRYPAVWQQQDGDKRDRYEQLIEHRPFPGFTCSLVAT